MSGEVGTPVDKLHGCLKGLGAANGVAPEKVGGTEAKELSPELDVPTFILSFANGSAEFCGERILTLASKFN